jgi:hypothetical protein
MKALIGIKNYQLENYQFAAVLHLQNQNFLTQTFVKFGGLFWFGYPC